MVFFQTRNITHSDRLQVVDTPCNTVSRYGKKEAGTGEHLIL